MTVPNSFLYDSLPGMGLYDFVVARPAPSCTNMPRFYGSSSHTKINNTSCLAGRSRLARQSQYVCHDSGATKKKAKEDNVRLGEKEMKRVAEQGTGQAWTRERVPGRRPKLTGPRPGSNENGH